MLSAIISDSLLFKSPTCTSEDVAAAKELAELAGVNPDEYGLEMLKAGADLRDKSVEELLTLDAKEFEMAGKKVEVAQVNTVDIQDVLSRQEELESALQSIIDKKNLDLFVFVVTDILNSDSTALVLGRETNVVEEAYGVKLENHTALLKGVVSRKKQIIPILTEVFNKR